jgi:hypothetical protein
MQQVHKVVHFSRTEILTAGAADECGNPKITYS